jgi:hypothetical protein
MRSFGHLCLAARLRGPGQKEVLDSRQNVHDVALAIDQLD